MIGIRVSDCYYNLLIDPKISDSQSYRLQISLWSTLTVHVRTARLLASLKSCSRLRLISYFLAFELSLMITGGGSDRFYPTVLKVFVLCTSVLTDILTCPTHSFFLTVAILFIWDLKTTTVQFGNVTFCLLNNSYRWNTKKANFKTLKVPYFWQIQFNGNDIFVYVYRRWHFKFPVGWKSTTHKWSADQTS